ncbi:hypothetical protein LIER_23803 [Lithospermum erythrorhizon]|uniref:RNase H type-1 domain-containing protein n=1 Tax=Lithospermum erythrorhizon TaxID=34254 RepID=A0AAV3R2K1_LITER
MLLQKMLNQCFEALGWHVIWVKNGNAGCDEICGAINDAKSVTDKPLRSRSDVTSISVNIRKGDQKYSHYSVLVALHSPGFIPYKRPLFLLTMRISVLSAAGVIYA